MKPLLVTIGDPAGIGAEVALKALQDGAAADRPVVLVGSPVVWRRAAALVGVDVFVVPEIEGPMEGSGWPVWPAADGETAACLADPATLNDSHLRERGEVQVRAIEAAVAVCRNGRAAAMVTMPIDKRANQACGVTFPGHTELIADLCGCVRPVMLLFGPDLRVVPITVHVPFRAVPDLLRADLVLETLRVVRRDVSRYFGIPKPRLGVCGLNPHAGEGGLFGTEEIHVLAPAVAQARREGIDAEGPVPADSAFAFPDRWDVILCPTHDQALIPLKQRHFACGVNTTLGLPIIRTSPDHGTARDIAWQGRADSCSAFHAIRAAVEFAARAGSVSTS
ncbi:MAG: 4-hydroxythreonine-4-phosphate dehydrogenase PdxA [Myxococcales bacterium]|nr:4-hydroxythreonine-4-phosphate dehydrogenase PdxA [Myxococcales bacterium]